MLTLDELGISPAPWDHDFCGRVTECGSGDFVANSNNPNNARLIAAAPMLYECLREAVIEACHDCNGYNRKFGDCNYKDGKCFVQRWHDALAAASGESEVAEDNARLVAQHAKEVLARVVGEEVPHDRR